MDFDNTHLKKWTPSFIPGVGYCREPSEWPRIPVGTKCITHLPNLKPLGALFLHVPDGRLPKTSRSLGAWGVCFGTRDTREAWVSRDIVGQFVLMHFLLRGGLLSPCLNVDTDQVEQNQTQHNVWQFAYLSGYNSYTGHHEIVLRTDHSQQTFKVKLEECVFQNWTLNDIKGIYKQEDSVSSHEE
jgi:hypothetical protein